VSRNILTRAIVEVQFIRILHSLSLELAKKML